MKLNFHRCPLYLFIPYMEEDSYKLVSLFEDFDHTSISSNIDATRKRFNLSRDLNLINDHYPNESKKVNSNFYEEFFTAKFKDES